MGEATRNVVKDVAFREVDRIKVKGKDAAITVYEPIGLEADADPARRDELRLWNQTLRAYRAGQWDQVEVNLLNLQRMYPGRGLYALYADRIAAFRHTPPPAGWDGVTVFDEK